MTEIELREVKKEAVLVLLTELLTRTIKAYDRYLVTGSLEGIGLAYFPDLLLDELEEIETSDLMKRIAPEKG